MSRYRPFRAVVIAEDSVSPERRYEIGKWLIESGCLYMMAWGKDCSAWDDAIDTVNLEAHDYREIPSDQHVMTTWHEGEDIDEVFWYSKNCASHSTVKLDATLLVHLADTPQQAELSRAYDVS